MNTKRGAAAGLGDSKEKVQTLFEEKIKAIGERLAFQDTIRQTLKVRLKRDVDALFAQNIALHNLLCSSREKMDKELALHKQTAEALLENENIFRSITSMAQDAIILMDNEGCVCYWNESAQRIFGYTKEEAMGKDFHQLAAPVGLLNAYTQGFAHFQGTGEGPVIGKTIEVQAVRKDGTDFPIELSVSAVRLKGKWHAVGIVRDVTERKLVEDTLRASEFRHKRLLGAVTTYTYTVLVENGRVTRTAHSPGCKALTGYAPEDYERDPNLWYRMIYEEDRSILLNHFSAVLSGYCESIEHRIVHKDGRIRWVRNTPALHYDENKNLVSYDGLIIDITEQKQVEEALRKYGRELEICVKQRTEELARAKNYQESVLASMNEALFVIGPTMQIQTVNQSAYTLTGYSRKELIGMSLSRLFANPASKELLAEKIFDFAQQAKKGLLGNAEEMIRAKDGTRIPVIFSASLLGADDGIDAGVVLVARDISDRKRAEEKLLTAYQFQHIINSLLQVSLKNVSLDEQLEMALDILISSPFMATVPKGVIFLVEEDTTDVLVMKAHRGLAKSLLDTCARIPFGTCLCGKAASLGAIVFADCVDKRHEITYEGMTGHGHYIIPVMSMGKVLGVIGLYLKEGHKKEEREVELFDAVANTIAGMIERQHSAEEKQKIQMKMLAASKMATLGEIATGIAHEINQPLTYISSFIQGLKMDIKHDTLDMETLVEELGTSYRQVKRIVDIIQHLRTVGRRDDVQMQPVDVEMAVDHTLLLMRERIYLRSIAFEKKIRPDLPQVYGNQNQLEQVFINLFQNALDAIPEKMKGAKITVHASPSSKREFVTIKVTDNGKGIGEKHLDKIFEPFFTTKEVGKGTGLGLSIVYGIISRYNGTINCESKPDEGTTFTITLPAVAPVKE